MNPNHLVITPPGAGEYLPYYGQYISRVAKPDILAALEEQIGPTMALLSGISDEKSEHRYAPGKWSIKEVVGHLADTERIMAYRALRFSRNDRKPLAGFEQDDYVREGPFRHCGLKDLVDEFACVRQASIHMFSHLNQEEWMRRGVADNAEISVRALAYVIAGHELHHMKILKEKYLQVPI